VSDFPLSSKVVSHIPPVRRTGRPKGSGKVQQHLEWLRENYGVDCVITVHQVNGTSYTKYHNNPKYGSPQIVTRKGRNNKRNVHIVFPSGGGR
jgi:hypothetical protein